MGRSYRKSIMLVASFILVSVLIGLNHGWQVALDIAVLACAIILLSKLCRTLLAFIHIGLARLELQPKRASQAYVITLFDDYAERYDRSLFDDLKYTGPSQLRQLVDDHGLTAEGTMVVGDMGCGTGACGPLFRGMASELVGIDLSPNMLLKATERDVYDRLHQSDLLTFLRQNTNRFDLLIAADVFVYLGDLEPVIEAAMHALHANGWIVFSVEHQAMGSYRLEKHGRFKHATAYIRSLAIGAGFAVRGEKRDTIRLEDELPVEASFWLMQKRGECFTPKA